MPTCLSTDDPDNVWDFCPSIAAAIIFAVLFGIATGAHIAQAVIYRKRFLWVLTMGAAWETAGFIFRCVSVYNPTSQAAYDPQYLLILLAPLWINAFDYMLLGRMIYYYLPNKKVFGIRAQKLGTVFVLLDVTTFLVQLAGGAMTVGQNSNVDIVNSGLHVYTAGIALQAVVILCFLSLAISFQRRIRVEISLESAASARKLLYILYASLGLILFRIIYRMVEFSAGANSSITNSIESHEVYPFVFDSVPMLIAVVLFNVFHPGTILVGPDSEFPKLTRAEKKMQKEERKRQKAETKREKRDRKEARVNGVELV